MGENSFIERRRHKRCKYGIKVGVFRAGEFHFEQCHEISEGGMLIAIQNHYEVGDRLEICFFLPSGDFFIVSASPVYTFQSGAKFAGIQFLNPPKDMVEKVREFVAQT